MLKADFIARVRACERRLYRVARTILRSDADCEDAVQETLLRAWSKLDTLRDEQYFETWLTRILINVCYDQLRRQKRFVPLEELSETAVEDFDALPLKEALRRLPKELRDVVILRFFADCTLAETADILGIPPGTAATRQRKALQLLRLELREEVTP